ncbi:hypothetical protein JCM37172_08600 [Faecalimonas hominis]
MYVFESIISVVKLTPEGTRYRVKKEFANVYSFLEGYAFSG